MANSKPRRPNSLESSNQSECTGLKGRGRIVRILATIAALFVVTLPAFAIDFPQLWKVDLKTLTESSATVADVNGDGIAEVLVAGREELFALGQNGETLWRWRTRGRFMTYPAVLPAKAGSPALIFAADASGMLTCLDGAGHVVWQHDLAKPSTWSASVVCDLESDGTPEVIQTDESGGVWAFDARSGTQRWHAQVTGAPVSPAVADITGDGRAEIAIVTGTGNVTLLDAAGTVLWTKPIGGGSETWATSAPVLFKASDGSGRVLAGSNGGSLSCFDAVGNVLWQRPTGGSMASGISVGDIDGDGHPDIFVATQLGTVHRFNEDGSPRWTIDTQGRSLAGGALIDLDGDGRLEYMLCTQGGRLLVFDNDARILYDYQFEHRTINVTPAFGEVSPKDKGLEMAITGGESGLVYCFATHVPLDARSAWTAYRGNENKSGAWLGPLTPTKTATRSAVETASPAQDKSGAKIDPIDLAPDRIFAGHPVRFALTRSGGDKPLVAYASCVGPDGHVQGAMTMFFGEHSELQLPLDVDVAGDYRFTWSVGNTAASLAQSGGQTVTLAPYAPDNTLATSALEALNAAAKRIDAASPSSGQALRHEAYALRLATESAKTLQGSGNAANRAQAREATSNLVSQAQRDMRLTKAVESAAATGASTSLVAFEGTLWENRNVDAEMPDAVTAPLKVHRRALIGEHEPIAVGLFNPLDYTVNGRVRAEIEKGGPAVTLRHSVPTVSSLGEMSWDALVALDNASLVSVPPLHTGELWIDLDTHGVAAGEHVVKIHVQATNGAGVEGGPPSPRSVPMPETIIEITLNVLPFEPASADAMRLCAWATLNPPAIADLLDHGNNAFVVPNGAPHFDAAGKMDAVDYTALDALLADMKGHDVFLLMNGVPGIPGNPGDAGYDVKLKSYLDNLEQHLGTYNIDKNHFALYPMDEPGGNGQKAVDIVVAFGKAVKSVRPDVMLYIDGGGELPQYEAMAPVVDVWCPAINMLAEDSDVMRVCRKHARFLWSYDCGYGYSRPAGPNIKNINIVGQFRTAALFAYRHGGSGIGYWSYNIGDDPWGRSNFEYPLVYPGATSPVPSRRWEAVREGIDDTRILAALQKRGDDPSVLADTKTKIHHLLDVSLVQLIDPPYREVSAGLARYIIDLSNTEAKMQAFRDEMLDCVEAISAKH